MLHIPKVRAGAGQALKSICYCSGRCRRLLANSDQGHEKSNDLQKHGVVYSVPAVGLKLALGFRGLWPWVPFKLVEWLSPRVEMAFGTKNDAPEGQHCL